MGRPPRVLLAGHTMLTRNLLRVAFVRKGLEVVAETPDGEDLIELCRECAPDVVVVDGRLAGGPVEERVVGLVEAGVRVLVLSEDPSPERLVSLLASGASGYLLHDVGPDQVADAVVAVASGEGALYPAATGTILGQWRRLRSEPVRIGSANRAGLTPREADILEAMADGLATKAIAHRLGVAVKTVENHKTRIFDKLSARTQAHAVSLAISHGLLADSGAGE